MKRKNPPSVDTPRETISIKVPKELMTQIKMAVPWDISRKQFIENIVYDAARAIRNGDKAGKPDPQPVMVGAHDSEAQNKMSRVTSSISTYSEGTKLFLSIACILDMLLTQRHGDWRYIINDETDITSEGFLLKGRLNISTIASKIADEFPQNLGGEQRQKTTKKYVKLAVEFLTQEQDHVVDLSSQAKPKAYRTLFGLARAVWKAKNDAPSAEIPGGEYPNSIHSTLSQGLNQNSLVTPDVLEFCLENARQQVIQQSSR
jgi:hypothetical protein